MTIVVVDPDLALRQRALQRAFDLAVAYHDIVPLAALREGFEFEGRRISFGSFQKGIHRAKEQLGPAALTLVTAPPRTGRAAPYDDVFDPDARSIYYHYRSGSIDQPDNRALRAAHEAQVPLIYLLGVSPGQYQVISPVFVTADDPAGRLVLLEPGLPQTDTQGQGLVSSTDVRRYQFETVRRRYHQAQFRRKVLHAYQSRCAVCALREPDLVEASHIIRDSEPEGIAAVVNGIALCSIHHLAYDRNLLGIDSAGVVHIGERLRRERDGPMLRVGLQGFHRLPISQPRRDTERPDPDRLAVRFAEFRAAA